MKMNLEGGARFLVLTFVFSWAEERVGATRTFYIRNMFFLYDIRLLRE